MSDKRSITFTATVGNDGEYCQFDDVVGIVCVGSLYPGEILGFIDCEYKSRYEFTITAREVSDE